MANSVFHTTLFTLAVIVNILTIGCNSDNHVRYKHLPVGGTGIQVDKIVTLDMKVEKEYAPIGDIVTLDTKVNRDTADRDDNVESEAVDKLLSVIADLKLDLITVKNTQENDRQRIADMESKLERYHGETMVSVGEMVQLRQLLSENFDKTAVLEQTTQDHSIAIESLQYSEKESTREIRRYRDYKERAAKRFHQIEKHLERFLQQEETTTAAFQNITQELEDIQNGQSHLRDLTFHIHQGLNQTLNITSHCCKAAQVLHKSTGTNQSEEYSLTNQNNMISTNQKTVQLTNEIDITDFGSGDIHDEYISKIEEMSNQVGDANLVNKNNRISDNIEQGSGELMHEFEGSGESSGEAEQLLPNVDFSIYMEKSTFRNEISMRDNAIVEMMEKYSNLSQYVGQLESRLTSIQLGNFMQSLQESLINFTQNVITIEQWKMSSNQIVNSTLNNQDQIIKLTNMILENTDKIADLKWKVSNGELLSDQQFSILRMYIIRLNNSVEDIKEQLKTNNGRQSVPTVPRYQSGYPGYQTDYESGNQFGDQSGSSSNNIETLASKMGDIGLQIIYNQNRIANLEVKMLNESLYTCRKYNMDAYQDTQLAEHEAMIKTNTNSILFTYELVQQLDKSVDSLHGKISTNSRKLRGLTNNFEAISGIIPAMVFMKKEVNNFLLQLPTDCSEYYQRGYGKPGVYVIHPITAQVSSQVTCHMTQNGGWTVIQQRFDGSLDFKKNWAEYREGFGRADSEYWLGNDIIYKLTSHKNYSLHIDMVDIHDQKWFATYDHFSVAHPSDKFKISISGYHGNATDALEYSDGMGFSTPDKDNDASSTQCAFFYESGWWYKHCQMCNLNGRYDIGFMWFDLNNNEYIRLKSSVMKIKPG